MELEEEFDINIPDDAAENIQTVGQAIDYIERAVEQEKGSDRFMKRRVVITGLGAVTSLSCQVADLWPRSAAARAAFTPSSGSTRRGFAPLRRRRHDWSTDDYMPLKDAKRLDRFTQFAMVAAIDAVRDSGLDFSKEDVRSAAA